MDKPLPDEQGVTEPLLRHESSFTEEPDAAAPREDLQSSASAQPASAPERNVQRPAATYDEEAALGMPPVSSSVDQVDLHNVPEATARWRSQRALMVAWLLGSILTLLLSSLSPFLGTTAGLAGITGSSWYFCHCCGVKQAKDIAANIQVVRRLAIAAAWLSGLYTFLLAIVGVGVCAGDEDYTQYCGALRIMFFILTSWHCLHSALSARVAYKAYKIEPLLNPFSSGILS